MNTMPDWYAGIRLPLLFLQSLVGMMLFAYPLRRRRHYAWLAAAGLTFALTATYLCGRFIYIRDTTTRGVISRIACAVLVYLLLFLFTWLCYEESVWTAMFVTSSGYISQDIAGSLKTMLKAWDPIAAMAADPVGIVWLDLVCYGGVFVLLFFAFRPFTCRRNENFDNKLKAVFSFGVLLLCIVMARLTQDNPDRNAIAQITESLYAILCGIFILILQFGVMESARLTQNVEEMEHLLQKQSDQYEASRSSMELVNEKYHDLKALTRSFHGQIPEEQMHKLEESVQQYDWYVHTGNEALDVLLTERRSICDRRGIQLTSLVNGADLAFMEALDLYTLLGNALDNAVEALSRLPEEQEKFISLTQTREGNMVTIHVENPFDGELTFADGLPSSTRDPRYHGFGMRSMEHIVQKYSGTLAVQQIEGLFCLDILLFS